jgi:hypothetical protein
MRKSRFSEEQIIRILKEHAAGLSARLFQPYSAGQRDQQRTNPSDMAVATAKPHISRVSIRRSTVSLVS